MNLGTGSVSCVTKNRLLIELPLIIGAVALYLSQCLEHLLDTLLFLFHVRMHIEIEGRADI